MFSILRLVFLVLFLPFILCIFGASLNSSDLVIINNNSSASSKYISIGKQILKVAHTNDNLTQQSTININTKSIPIKQTTKLQKMIPNKLTKNTAEAVKVKNSATKHSLTNQSTKKISAPSKIIYQEKYGLDLGAGNGIHAGHGVKRKRRKQKEEKGLMEKMLPMMATPFLISSGMVPMMLVSLFFTMVKSAFLGKIGIILMLINMFSNRRNPGAATTHTLDMKYAGNQVAMDHYGWHGDEEYGAYVNKRRKRRT